MIIDLIYGMFLTSIWMVVILSIIYAIGKIAQRVSNNT